MDPVTSARQKLLTREAQLLDIPARDHFTEIKQAFVDGDYGTASKVARELRGLILCDLLACTGRTLDLQEALAQGEEAAADTAGLLRQIRDDKGLKDQLRTLLAKHHKEGDVIPRLPQDKAAFALALLESKKLPRVLAAMAKEHVVPEQQLQLEGRIDDMVLGHLASLYADAERIFARHRVESRRGVFECIEAEVALHRETLEAQHAELFSACAVGSSRAVGSLELAAERAVDILVKAEQTRLRFSNLLATVALAQQDAAERSGPSSEHKWALLNLDVQALVRTGTSLTLLASAVITSAANPRQQPWLDGLMRDARRRKIASSVEDGANASVKQLADRIADYDDRFVETVGFVTKLETYKEDGGKTSSAFSLVDRRTERSIRVIAPHRQLAYAGVAEGAAARVHGRAYQKDGEPRLRIDVVSLSTAAKESWHDTWCHALREVFCFWPAGFNVLVAPALGQASGPDRYPEIIRIPRRY